MKNIKKYKMVHETPAHFIMHDGQAHFHIAKKGLDKQITAKIQGFADGGDVKKPEEKKSDAIYDNLDQSKVKAFGNPFAKYKGGEIESPADEEEKAYADEIKPEPKQLELDPPGTRMLYDPESGESFKDSPPQYSFYEGGFAEKVGQSVESLRRAKKGSMYGQEKETTPNADAAPYNPEGEKRAEDRIRNAPDTLEELHARQKKQGYSKGGMVEKVLAAKAALSGKKGYAGENMSSPLEQEVTATQAPLQDLIPQAPVEAVSEVSPEMQQQIEQEKQRLAVSSGMPGATMAPGAPQPDNSAFNEEATTNIANNFMNQQKAAEMEDKQNQELRAAEIKKITSDNAARAAAGLPQLPVPQMTSSVVPQPVAPGDTISLKGPLAKNNVIDVAPTAASEFQRGSDLQIKGIKDKATAEAQAAQTNETNLKNFVTEEKKRQEITQKHLVEINAANETMRQDIMSKKVDPNRLWKNSSTGAQIAASIGILLGGIGGGITGQPNAAMAFIQKAIDNDIEAQKTDQSTATNMYRMGLERYKNEQSAAQFATLQAHNILSAQLQQSAAKLGTQNAYNTANMMLGELAKADAPIKQNLAVQGAALSMLNQPSKNGVGAAQAGGVNPMKIRALSMSGLLPKEELPKVMTEYGEYTKAKDLLDRTEKVFSEGAKFATYTERMAKGVPGGKMIPTFREDTKRYNALVDSFLDKLTKDMTGRVTPESIKLLKESMPIAGDDAVTRQNKLSNIRDIVKGSFSFPTMTVYGILDENDPVIRTDANIEQRFTPGKPKGK